MLRTIFIVLLLAALLLSGCETIGGFGRDLQKAGSWLERNSGTH